MYTNFLAVSSLSMISPSNSTTENPSSSSPPSTSTGRTGTKNMSVFQYATQTPLALPPSYTRSPKAQETPKTEPPVYKPSQSTISIPSTSKLSFSNLSLAPITRIFSSFSPSPIPNSISNGGVERDTEREREREENHFSTPPSTNSSLDSLTTIPTTTTRQTSRSEILVDEIEEVENESEVRVPPPMYSPIKSPTTKQPTRMDPPAYEPQDREGGERRASNSDRAEGSGGRSGGAGALTSPYSAYDEGYHSRYVGEGWAGSQPGGGQVDGGWRDGEAVKNGEKGEEEESGWCGKWWVLSGSPSMPWVAYYVF